MGGFDIGGLYGSMNLDDSQFTQALQRAGGASTLLKINVKDLTGSFVDILTVLEKAGYNTQVLTQRFATQVNETTSLNDVLKEFASTLGQVQSRAGSLKIGNVDSKELENYRAMLEAERSRLNALMQEYKVKTDMLNLNSRLRAEEDAGIKATVQGLEMGRQLSLNSKEEQFKSDQDYANLKRKLTQESLDAEVKASKKATSDRITLANQYADAAYKAAALDAKAQRDAEAAERARFIEHRRMMQESQALSTVGRDLALVGGIGLGGGLFVAKEAAEFQDAMTKSLAVIGPVSNALRDNLADAARTAAKETGLAAKDLAADYAVMAKGGLVAAESLEHLGLFSKYAVANQVDVHDATKQVLTVMEALGLKTTDLGMITNELTRANQLARGSVEGLAQAMEGRGGVALRNAHVGLEEALAITVAFTKAGFSASEAQTAMSQAVNRLTAVARTHGDTTVWLTDRYTKFRDIVYDGQGNIRRMSDMLTDLNKVMAGRSSESVGQLFDDIKMGTTRGVDGIKTLIAQAPLIDKLTQTFKDSGGALDQAFNIQMLSPIKQMELLKNRITDLEISLGTVFVTALQSVLSVLGPVFSLVEDLVKGFTGLPEPLQQFLALAGLVSTTGTLAAGGILMMAGGMVRLAADLQLLATSGALTSVLELMTGLAASTGAVAAAVLTVAVGSYALVKLGNKQIDHEFAASHSLADMTSEDLGVQKGGKAISFGSGLIDNVRKSLDEMKALVKAQMASIVEDPALFKDPKKDEALAAKVARQQAELEDAQTSLNKFAEAYNNNFQLLTDDQRKFIEGSFAGLNDLLGKGVASGNLSTFKAELAKYSESLKSFTADAKKGLETEKLTNELDKMSQKFSDAEGYLSDAELSYLNSLITRIKQLFSAGVDPRLIDSLITEFNNKLGESVTIGKELESTSKSMGRELEQAFKMTTAAGKEANKELSTTLTAIQQLRVTNPAMADKLEGDFRGQQILKGLGIQDRANSTQTQNATMELIGIDSIPLVDKQKAVIKMFEEMAVESGKSAEEISQQQQFMINGVVQDYDALKDRVRSNLSAVHQSWIDLTKDLEGIISGGIGKLGGALFDTLFPDFTNGNTANPLQPLVDNLRTAFEQLASYSDPKAALNNLIASIKGAGTAAQANAIAVKYFGTTAGPMLASELRNGTISATDLSKALDLATKSTLDYVNQSKDQVSALSTLWKQVVKDIIVAIVERLIMLGIVQLLVWLGIINKQTNTLASAMDQVFTKLAEKLVKLFTGVGVAITSMVKSTIKAVEAAINGMYAEATVVIHTIHIDDYQNSGGGSSGGGNLFQNVDPFGNGGWDWLNQLTFGGPSSYSGSEEMQMASRRMGNRVGTQPIVAISPRSDGLNVNGPVNVYTNDPKDFVRQLKQLRLVQGF